jgi:hypothetical protein
MGTLPARAREAWIRPRIYVGSGTDGNQGGVSHRFSQYDRGVNLPSNIEKPLNDGFEITHKGLLCWTAIPSAALRPTIRLLLIAMEAAFAFAFWAMRTTEEDDGLSQLCPWTIDALPYDGLCSHCCLQEGVAGDLGLT